DEGRRSIDRPWRAAWRSEQAFLSRDERVADNVDPLRAYGPQGLEQGKILQARTESERLAVELIARIEHEAGKSHQGGRAGVALPVDPGLAYPLRRHGGGADIAFDAFEQPLRAQHARMRKHLREAWRGGPMHGRAQPDQHLFIGLRIDYQVPDDREIRQ